MSDWDDDDWGTGFGDSIKADTAPVSVPRQHTSVPDKVRFGRGPRAPLVDGHDHGDANDSQTLLVDCKMCGKIIGKGGSTIRELEEKSGAKIRVVRDREENFKVPVTITGAIHEREKASVLIEEILNKNDFFARDNHYTASNSFHSTSSERQHFGSFTGEKKTIGIKSSSCGRVIGRGGSKIKELQENSGARINVKSNEGDGESTPVILSGTQDQIEKAETLIEELINEISPVSVVVRGNDCGEKMDGFTSSGLIDWGNVNNLCREQSKKRWENAVPIQKKFYIEDDCVGDMLPIEVEEWRKENFNISVTHLVKGKPSMILNPVLTFEQAFKYYPEILETIYAQGFSKPSPIQSQAWPLVLNGYDVIGIAQTGTGKTLAFLLPAFIHIDGQSIPRSERPGPTCLILTPTRELALQIEMEIKKYHYRGIRCVCVYGGGDRRKQINMVTNGVEIIVATPGRFNDLLANEFVTLDSVTFLVLDEADRMLDMGFEPQIMKILIDIRPDRQTMMTSATWPEGVRRLARSYLTDPMQVAVGSLDLAAVHTVTQIVEVIAQEEKRDRLLDFIDCMEAKDKVLVFVGRKTTADDLSADLCMRNILCQSIHGGREQYDREQALDDFKTGTVHILVATDVASRGLDVADVTHVFNYDYPRNTEEYVHRVGRTGRAGKSGTSITLVTREDWSTAKELIDILVEAQQDVPIELYDMAERFAKMKERREREGGFRGGRRGGFRRNNNRW